MFVIMLPVQQQTCKADGRCCCRVSHFIHCDTRGAVVLNLLRQFYKAYTVSVTVLCTCLKESSGTTIIDIKDQDFSLVIPL